MSSPTDLALAVRGSYILAGMNTIGQRIKAIRTSMGETQEKIGQAIGVDRVAVSNWENGKDKPSLDNLLALASHAKLPASVFLGDLSEAAGNLAIHWQSLPVHKRAITWHCLNDMMGGKLERRNHRNCRAEAVPFRRQRKRDSSRLFKRLKDAPSL
jgi:transcriptional regulator with XRE-family HTH domain